MRERSLFWIPLLVTKTGKKKKKHRHKQPKNLELYFVLRTGVWEGIPSESSGGLLLRRKEGTGYVGVLFVSFLK